MQSMCLKTFKNNFTRAYVEVLKIFNHIDCIHCMALRLPRSQRHEAQQGSGCSATYTGDRWAVEFVR